MTPKEECEELLGFLMTFAENQLKKRGGFYPFGAVLQTDGTIAATAYQDEETEFPESTDVIRSLTRAHREEAEKGKIKASGIAWDAGITTADGRKTDAVTVSLEHADHYAVVVSVPYRRGLLGRLTFGAMLAEKGMHEIFN